MTFWIRQIKGMSSKEKGLLLLFLGVQAVMAYLHFFIVVNRISWNELIFSLVLIIPWVLSLTFYLNFKMLPLNQPFLRIRLALKKRISQTLQIVTLNIVLSCITIVITALFATASHFHLREVVFLTIEMVLRYGLFLFIASLIQLILMTIFKNKGLVTIILYLGLFIGSYLTNPKIIWFMYPALYPPTLTLSSLLLVIGYVVIFGVIYVTIEEQKELF